LPVNMPGIAFLGTGIMGAPMCKHLLDEGYPLTIWNRTAAKTNALASAGATVTETPAQAIVGAEIVIVMLSSGPVVTEVLLSNEMLSAYSANTVVVVMSSIPVESARMQSRRFEGYSLGYVDAPVSGGEQGAIEGKLSIMAGGSIEVIERVQNVLSCMGRVLHVGPVGTGQLAKLANQTVVGITICAVAEALLLAKAGGADLPAVREALLGGFADSTILKQHGARMIEGNFVPGGKAEVQLKDLRTARELAESMGMRLPALELTESLYKTMCENGHDQLDHSALYLELSNKQAFAHKLSGEE